MASVSLSRAWEETKAIFASDGRLLVAVALALIVLPSLIGTLAAPEGAQTAGAESSAFYLQMVVALIAIAGQLALVRLAIGPATTVGAAIAHGFRRFLPAFGALFILIVLFTIVLVPVLMLLASVGIVDISGGQIPPAALLKVMLLIGLLALAIAPRFVMVTPVASAERAGPIAIIRRSLALTRGHYGRMLALVLLLVLVAVILMVAAGLIGGTVGKLIDPDLEPFSLGALVFALFASAAQGVFTTLSSLMVARTYLQLAGAQAEASVPGSAD